MNKDDSQDDRRDRRSAAQAWEVTMQRMVTRYTPMMEHLGWCSHAGAWEPEKIGDFPTST